MNTTLSASITVRSSSTFFTSNLHTETWAGCSTTYFLPATRKNYWKCATSPSRNTVNLKNGSLFWINKSGEPLHLRYRFMTNSQPSLYTPLSPALLHLYDVNHAIVVIIDVLRATSTIATALHNGAKCVIPVDSVAKCIELGRQIDGITAGERDGMIAEGLQHGNSPFEYSREFINNRTLVLTTTNGTKLLHMALDRGAGQIITGSFPNLGSVCDYLISQNQPVVLGCAAWKHLA